MTYKFPNQNQPNQPFNPPFNALKGFKGSLVLILLALIGLTVVLLRTARVQRVSGTEVGIKVNNVTGDITVIAESGTNIYNGLLNSFHLLDMTVQRLEMVSESGRGQRSGRDDLRIKTVDGSDVFLDLTINYQIRRDMVEAVVTTSGLDDAYKYKWVRDYSRSVCRNVFGEMTTEEFYDASVRNVKAQKAMEELNVLLKPYGIEISSVIAEKFSFHKEYEERIRAKKLADQEVEEQISKANAARQNQIFREVEATKKKEVVIASYTGEMKKLIVEATANAERDIRQAEAYVIDTQLGADATFYQREKNAQAILVKAQAEGEALTAMAQAYAGIGGVNLVKRAYAHKVGDMQISGQPFTIESRTERLSYQDEAAVAKKKVLK
jgi:regulator of protease activity HflC (stomatin/prohibitin superfamily)